MASHTAALLEFWQEQACKHWKALRQNAPVHNEFIRVKQPYKTIVPGVSYMLHSSFLVP